MDIPPPNMETCKIIIKKEEMQMTPAMLYRRPWTGNA
jgi:hypothetical protein